MPRRLGMPGGPCGLSTASRPISDNESSPPLDKFHAEITKRCVAQPANQVYTIAMKTILAPIDFSNISAAVAEEAAYLARKLDGRLILLTVVQPPVVVADYAGHMENIAEIMAAGEKNAERRLAEFAARLTDGPATVETLCIVGTPVTQIIEHAETHRADYIVMGSHGHTAFYDLLVGSTAQAVLKRAKCPVLIVPPARAVPEKKTERHAAAV